MRHGSTRGLAKVGLGEAQSWGVPNVGSMPLRQVIDATAYDNAERNDYLR
jgi:hypothetical protein